MRSVDQVGYGVCSYIRLVNLGLIAFLRDIKLPTSRWKPFGSFECQLVVSDLNGLQESRYGQNHSPFGIECGRRIKQERKSNSAADLLATNTTKKFRCEFLLKNSSDFAEHQVNARCRLGHKLNLTKKSKWSKKRS